MADQGAGGVLAVLREGVGGVHRNQLDAEGLEVLVSDFLHHQVPAEAGGVLHQQQGDVVLGHPVEQVGIAIDVRLQKCKIC